MAVVEGAAVVPRVKLKAFCPSPVAAVLVFWKSEPPKPAKAPPKERPVEAVVVGAVVPPKFNVKPVVPAAGVDVRADDNDRPPAEVEVTGKANGVAEPAGLLKPKLKPVVAADVVAGVPSVSPVAIVVAVPAVLVPPSVKPVVDFDPKSPLPKPTEGADVVAVAVEEPRVPKLSPPVELGVAAPKEKPPPPPPPPAPAAAAAAEPRVPAPKEKPVDMAAAAGTAGERGWETAAGPSGGGRGGRQ